MAPRTVKPLMAAMPEVAFAVPQREVKTPHPIERTPELDEVYAKMHKVVMAHGRDPENPWAVSHAIVALGADVVLANDKPAVDYLFAEYARPVKVNGRTEVRFERQRGKIRVEPHTDLILKALTERGVAPDRTVILRDGSEAEVGDLYRGALRGAWVKGETTGFDSWNDSPWAVQGLATWAPPGLAWSTQGHAMTMDGLTDAMVDKLRAESAFLREAQAAGTPVQKRKQGIFAYTCGGAHLLQGSLFAVGRGFGAERHRAALRGEVDTLHWRVDLELKAVDDLVAQHPQYALILMVQRLKFLGHFVETVHKAMALGLFEPTPVHKAQQERVVAELVATVQALDDLGAYENMDAVRKSNEQTYLDMIGDSAHAMRGIDLATGKAALAY